MTITVLLPTHLQRLAGIAGPVELLVEAEPPTQRHLLDALEAAHPALAGTVRDRSTGRRRAYLRFFVGEEDRSHDHPDAPLPDEVAQGTPFAVVGAMAGG